MSIINQMLRDLDARGVASDNSPAVDNHVLRLQGRPASRKKVLLFVLLLAGGGAAYWALTASMRQPLPLAEAEMTKQGPAASPIAIAPPSLVMKEPELVSDPLPPAPSAVIVSPPVTTAVDALDRAHPKLALSLHTKTVPRETPQIEPVVVKKMAEVSPEFEAQQLFDEAQVMRRAGKIDVAMGKYRLALERSPGLRQARIQWARLMQESGQADAAFTLLKAGYDQQPDGGMAIALGRLLADMGRQEDALNWLERGLGSLRPSDHALMGALLSQSSRNEEAVKAYQRALAANPNQGGWLLGQGLALEALGRREEAQRVFGSALERGDFNPDVVKFLRQKIGASSQ